VRAQVHRPTIPDTDLLREGLPPVRQELARCHASPLQTEGVCEPGSMSSRPRAPARSSDRNGHTHHDRSECSGAALLSMFPSGPSAILSLPLASEVSHAQSCRAG
jgi:hypothetical protein